MMNICYISSLNNEAVTDSLRNKVTVSDTTAVETHANTTGGRNITSLLYTDLILVKHLFP